ncbi:MAG: hypothetical protein AB9Q19_01290 [Candidatus Reddybacter sp.]
MQSKVRLDPLSNVFDLRVYAESGDPATPLAEEMRPPVLVARVTIAGHIAEVTTTKGKLGDDIAWQDFDRTMASKGVTELHWQRHKNGKVLQKKRQIRGNP